MTRHEYILVPLVLLLLLSAEKSTTYGCPDDELYVIRSVGSGGALVLDGSEPPKVLLQYFTGFSPQLWQFKRGNRAGLFYIINNHTQQAMDFARDATVDLVTTKKGDTLDQQWSLLPNGRIVNAVRNLNIDVDQENYTNGARIHLHENNGRGAQEFQLELNGQRPNIDWCHHLLR